MSDDPALPVIELGGIRVFDAREWFPYKGGGGAVVFRPRTVDQIEEVAIHQDAVAFSGADLNFNGTTVDEERARMQASYNWHTEHWPAASYRGGGWNWPGLGYHLYTFPSGRIYLVGEILTIRAHVAYRNTRSGGVAGAGDFTRQKPQAAHIVAYAQATAFIWLARGAELPVEGHRTWAAQNPVEVRRAWGTSCPGETHETWIPDVRRVAKIEYKRAQKEDDDMTKILRIGRGASQSWSPHTFVSDGYRARHVTDAEAMHELQQKGIWPTEETRISWQALKQLVDDPSKLPDLGF